MTTDERPASGPGGQGLEAFPPPTGPPSAEAEPADNAPQQTPPPPPPADEDAAPREPLRSGNPGPSDTKPAEAKPADAKPAEAKPADTKPTDTKPADARPAEAKPTDAKPADARPAEAKPTDAKPAEAKPATSATNPGARIRGGTTMNLGVKSDGGTDASRDSAAPSDSTDSTDSTITFGASALLGGEKGAGAVPAGPGPKPPTDITSVFPAGDTTPQGDVTASFPAVSPKTDPTITASFPAGMTDKAASPPTAPAAGPGPTADTALPDKPGDKGFDPTITAAAPARTTAPMGSAPFGPPPAEAKTEAVVIQAKQPGAGEATSTVTMRSTGANPAAAPNAATQIQLEPEAEAGVPPGPATPGLLPPGVVPPGPATPGLLPPGVVPPGPVPPGLLPPAPGKGTGAALAAAMTATTSGAQPGLAAAARTKLKGRSPLLLAAAGVASVLVLVYAVWAIDLARTNGEVTRNTYLATSPIGGLNRAELDQLLAELDSDLGQRPLQVTVDNATVATNPAALGAGLDRAGLADDALAARRSLNPLTGPISWISSFMGDEIVEPRYAVDPAIAETAASDVVGAGLVQMSEPRLVIDDNGIAVEPGSDGVEVDPSEIVQLLPAALTGDSPDSLTLTAIEVTPTFTNEQIQALADESAAATNGPTEVQILDQSALLAPNVVRSWITVDDSGDEPTWHIDQEAALATLKPEFPVLGSDDQRARFDLVGNKPVVIPASETVVCCDPASLAALRSLLVDAPRPEDSDEGDPEAPARVIILEPEVVGSDEGVADLESLGIVEQVSTFTTKHAPNQPRVTNIHRFADLMRGVVIRPGEDLSLNGHVGRRTIEKGFVADGAIVDGVLEPQVGGGVSQFATTFFNAAFYAGIDFNQYQSHSLYISRYPQGREATISHPAPDLSVKNTTDYGILVWTSYTDITITVTFYSTKNIEVQDLPVIRTSEGECSRYTTPRVRTYQDGTTVEDSVFAVYRPAEGFDCDGNSTRPEKDPKGPSATTDTIVPAEQAPAEPPAPVAAEPTDSE